MPLRPQQKTRLAPASSSRFRVALRLALLAVAVLIGHALLFSRGTSVSSHAASEHGLATGAQSWRVTRGHLACHHARHGSVPSFKVDPDDDDDDGGDDVLAPRCVDDVARPEVANVSVPCTVVTGLAAPGCGKAGRARRVVASLPEARGPPTSRA